MGFYINRDGAVVDLQTQNVAGANVRIRTIVVGSSVLVELLEYADASVKPLSKSRITGLVRNAAKPHLLRPTAVKAPIADTTITRKYGWADANGHPAGGDMRVRSATYLFAG